MRRDQIAALNRLLCNLANLQSSQRHDHNDHFCRYGVLREAILTRLDQQDQQMQRLMAVGMWWDEERSNA